MTCRLSSGVAVLVAGAFSVGASQAQSLGDLAQKEKEKRGAARAGAAGGKVYGDGDLAVYSGERPAEDGEAQAMSATPKAGSAKKASPAPAPERAAAALAASEAEDKAAAADSLRARWREAQLRVASAERKVAAIEEEMKTLPPGLPLGNYYDDIRAAMDQQKVEREQRFDLAKKDLAAAKDARDILEVEARRKMIRLD